MKNIILALALSTAYASISEASQATLTERKDSKDHKAAQQVQRRKNVGVFDLEDLTFIHINDYFRGMQASSAIEMDRLIDLMNTNFPEDEYTYEAIKHCYRTWKLSSYVVKKIIVAAYRHSALVGRHAVFKELQDGSYRPENHKDDLRKALNFLRDFMPSKEGFDKKIVVKGCTLGDFLVCWRDRFFKQVAENDWADLMSWRDQADIMKPVPHWKHIYNNSYEVLPSSFGEVVHKDRFTDVPEIFA